MYFEAQLKGKKYKVDVNETRYDWKIGLQEEGGEWMHYEFPKTDYKQAEQYISFLFKGSSYLIDVIGADTEYTVFTRGSFRTIPIFNDEMLLHESLKHSQGFGGEKELTSGMPGKIIEILVKPGDEVAANTPLLIMEAMKMENELRSSSVVKIKEICVKPGDNVEANAIMMRFE